jgi:hypothetical protein
MSQVYPTTVLRGHEAEVQSVDFIEGGTALLSGDSAGSARCWDLASARATVTAAHPSSAGLTRIRQVPTEQRVVTQGRDGEVKLWQLRGDGSLLAEGALLHTQSYHFCGFAIAARPSSAGTGGGGAGLAHAIAVASPGNMSVDVWDLRGGMRAVEIAGAKETGMSMSLCLPAAAPHLVVAGCAPLCVLLR